jgi:hypothetical protein
MGGSDDALDVRKSLCFSAAIIGDRVLDADALEARRYSRF